MIVRTVEQVRRAFRIVAGFTLLLAGVVMIITPGPGWLVIFLGLSLLAAEFIWARRLMDRMKRQGERVREAAEAGESDGGGGGLIGLKRDRGAGERDGEVYRRGIDGLRERGRTGCVAGCGNVVGGDGVGAHG